MSEREIPETLKESVRKVFEEQLGLENLGPKDDHRTYNELDPNADSLDEVEILMALEDEFGMEISDEDATRVLSVNDACQYLMENRHRLPKRDSGRWEQ